ncbi:MAG: PGF-CTERM sorting domain-containing protein [Halobacteriota archaeon]
MDKIQKSAVIAVLFLSLAVIVMGVLPATAADVVVTRDLPDEPVGPKPEVITVTLTQSGFFQIGDVGWVNETLPEGFTYEIGSVVDGDGYTVVIDEDYMETTDKITIPFGTSENTTTMTYKVEADTKEHIRDAEFVGTWKTPISLNPLEYQPGEVTGDTKLTAAEEEPTPTPTPSSNGVNGGNGGGGGSGVTTPTTTPGETPTTSPTSGATATQAGSFTPTPTGVPTSTPTQSPSPTKKPLIPGFEAVFAIAGLLAVTYLVIRIRR